MPLLQLFSFLAFQASCCLARGRVISACSFFDNFSAVGALATSRGAPQGPPLGAPPALVPCKKPLLPRASPHAVENFSQIWPLGTWGLCALGDSRRSRELTLRGSRTRSSSGLFSASNSTQTQTSQSQTRPSPRQQTLQRPSWICPHQGSGQSLASSRPPFGAW